MLLDEGFSTGVRRHGVDAVGEAARMAQQLAPAVAGDVGAVVRRCRRAHSASVTGLYSTVGASSASP
jgi:hypothetical protein